MAENSTGRRLLVEKDFAEVVDADGNALPSVPKHWTEDDLAPGASFKKKSAKASGSTSGGSNTPADGEPKGNASRDEWAAYATTKGAPDEETKPVEDGGLSRDDLKAKYGTSES